MHSGGIRSYPAPPSTTVRATYFLRVLLHMIQRPAVTSKSLSDPLTKRFGCYCCSLYRIQHILCQNVFPKFELVPSTCTISLKIRRNTATTKSTNSDDQRSVSQKKHTKFCPPCGSRMCTAISVIGQRYWCNYYQERSRNKI